MNNLQSILYTLRFYFIFSSPVVQYPYNMAWLMVSTWDEFTLTDNNRSYPDKRTLHR